MEESCAPAALTPPGQIPLTNPFVSQFSRCQRLSLPAADPQGAVPCPRAPPNLGINPVTKPSSALGSHQQSPTATILIPTLKRTPKLPPLRDFPYQEIFQPAENLHAASCEGGREGGSAAFPGEQEQLRVLSLLLEQHPRGLAAKEGFLSQPLFFYSSSSSLLGKLRRCHRAKDAWWPLGTTCSPPSRASH